MGGAAAGHKRRPLIARVHMAGLRGAHRSILHDFEDDRISRYTGNETRLLSLMSAPWVNSETAKQKDRPKAVSLSAD
jgi:hypothetical protein